jgi:membrane protein DedA with SNARE-associated domain
LDAAPLPGRLKGAALGLFVVLVVAGLLGSALAPLLLVRAPLLLVALAPDARHVALAVSSVPLVELVVLAVLRRALFSVAVFGLGASYGDLAVAWVEQRSARLGRMFRALERLFARWGAPILLLLPFASLCVLAGAARTRFSAFLSATLLGHALWVGATYYVGALLSGLTDRFLSFVSQHVWECTIICVALVLSQQLIARRRARLRA